MRTLYEILEFDAIRNQVAAFCRTEMARNQAAKLEHSTDPIIIQEWLDETRESLDIIFHYGGFGFDYVHNLLPLIERATKGSILNVEELYRIGSQTDAIRALYEYQKQIQSFLPSTSRFKQLCAQLIPCKSLREEIDRCITPNLEISDAASPELRHIRRALIMKEQAVRKQLDQLLRSKSEYLSEMIITLRNDRLVLPVKTAYKYALGGIIHDQSDSGQTVYVEPELVLSLNAELMRLKQEERDEIQRILANLSALVRQNSEPLERNVLIFQALDFMLAKGHYGKAIDGSIPMISETQEVYLRHARHPLLPRESVISNNYHLGGTSPRICLITGPNTGGKTVALKTIGLLSIMMQSGLPIPAESDARLGIFSRIYVDIGDEQSLEQSLSTFSSHMKKLIETVQGANHQSLVLIDEIGGGTDPKEGESLAMAILDQFEQRQCILMATTHYSNLKTFAVQKSSFQNASMNFDESELRPTYRLRQGIPGQSYAFEISERLGLPKSIIQSSRNYKEYYSSQAELLMETMQTELNRLDDEKQLLQLREKKLAEQEIEVRTQQELLQKKEEELSAKSTSIIANKIEEAEARIDQIVLEMQTKQRDGLKMHEWIDAKRQLTDLQEEDQNIEETTVRSYAVGEQVQVLSLSKTGKVVRKSGEEYVVLVGNVNLQVHAKQLAKSHKPNASALKKNQVSIQADRPLRTIPMELNLIGLRVSEAMPLLDKYLDDARQIRLKSVRIIHGSGTGALRLAVHQFLDQASFIESYRLGGAGEGGVGATVIQFKEGLSK
jgi:DNA mismatch repair protein MutS2